MHSLLHTYTVVTILASPVPYKAQCIVSLEKFHTHLGLLHDLSLLDFI